MSRRTLTIGFTVLSTFCVATPAGAGLVTFAFSGQITSVRDDTGVLGGGVNVGDAFSGFYTFESDTLDARPESPYDSRYSAITDYRGVVGTVALELDVGQWGEIAINVAHEAQRRDVYSVGGAFVLNEHHAGGGLVLVDYQGTSLEDDLLVLLPPALAGFEDAVFRINSVSKDFAVSGEVTALTLVPEPGTLLLLGAGTMLIARRRRSVPRRRGARPKSALFFCAVWAVIGVSSSLKAQTTDCACTDMVFLIDTSSSMAGAADAIATELSFVIEAARFSTRDGDLRVGLITFGTNINVVHPLTDSLTNVTYSLGSLTFDASVDPAEPSDEALREMLSDAVCTTVVGDFNTPLRSECRKHAILVTDAPPSGCDATFDLPDDEDNADVRAQEAAAMGVTISSVLVVPTGGADPDAERILRNYADTTGGVYVEVPANGAGMERPLVDFVRVCTDCNGNGIPDRCDVDPAAAGCPAGGVTAADCNCNGVPDTCEIDESGAVPGGTCFRRCADDCNDDGIPDVCEMDAASDAAGGPFFCQDGTCGADCNDNGRLDGCEMLGPAPIEAVFLIDTSTSMGMEGGTIEGLCSAIAFAQGEFSQNGPAVDIEVLRIGAGWNATACACCTEIVPRVYGAKLFDYPEIASLGSCGFEDDDLEDWGPATAIVAERKDWGDGLRIIFPASDEGPRCGLDVLEDDQASVELAGESAWNNRTIVAPYMPTSSSATNVTLIRGIALTLADQSAPGGRVLDLPDPGPARITGVFRQSGLCGQILRMRFFAENPNVSDEYSHRKAVSFLQK